MIVDASVALKWVLDEDESEAAIALLTHNALAAPDLLWIECANVLWVKARRGLITAQGARAALAAIDAAPIRSLQTRPLALVAQAIALDLGQTAYDCLYLAAALSERTQLVTADTAFAQVARAHPVYLGAILAL